MATATVKVGQRGTVVIPVDLRKEYGIEEGSLLIAESVAEGILFRPAAVFSVEIYTPERKAEFLLNNAVNDEDYVWAVNEVRKLGLDPANIPHERPGKK
ncbi:MAG TPA: AbrB/MazE/SpoVT family DNA-binding domain-containing protein [Spirochaetia bacterium]|nr:AbrB/MazE/SpoVT family DNA-binding domain-containing protein [Spirochaetia bacterium]